MSFSSLSLFFFFFNIPPTTEIYTLSLHDALPISSTRQSRQQPSGPWRCASVRSFPCDWRRRRRDDHLIDRHDDEDRKSTRLNSSHTVISYAVFCLKKKKKK